MVRGHWNPVGGPDAVVLSEEQPVEAGAVLIGRKPGTRKQQLQGVSKKLKEVYNNLALYVKYLTMSMKVVKPFISVIYPDINCCQVD